MTMIDNSNDFLPASDDMAEVALRPSLKREFKMFNPVVQFENPWMKVVDYQTSTDGTPGIYTVIERRDAAVCVLENVRGEILLVNSYRYPIQDTSWELPMGGIELGEEPEVAAVRELVEETGATASLIKIGEFCPVPGLTPQKAHIFYGQVSAEEERKILEFQKPTDELVGWNFVARDGVRMMIKNCQIKDGITLGALAFLFSNVDLNRN